MLTIASKKGVEKLVTTEEYVAQRFVYDDLIERGEPYVFQAKIPLIIELGPKTYWQMHVKDFEVYGEGIDPDEFEEIEDVLGWRRQGHVYGRWYSKYCTEGETGYFFHSGLTPVSRTEFQKFVHRIEEKNDSSGL
jgi:hypothetical protein